VELESQHDNQSELSCSQIPSESQETVIMTLRNELQNTKLELSESEKTITLLKELLEKEKNKSRDLESSITEREQKKFVAQKQELEGVIERHL
jgi:3-dehydroquinate dehydratase